MKLEKSRFKNASLWLALSIVAVTVILMIAVYFRFLRLHIALSEFDIHHWLSWTGTLFIAFFTPAYYFLKRRYPQKFRTLLKAHVFGNLLSVMFVSIHLTQQISRPPQAYPQLGTGIVLYAAMILLTLTGFFLRFQAARNLTRRLRFLHTSVAVSFYLIIVVHVLHGLEII
ncbi:MAG TPA: hypothetical protein VI864_06635 [Candidatus Bathyarchaeia archaeon]|nr:hypothetical protein [Candidatus Bathyarchaeia archaeon]